MKVLFTNATVYMNKQSKKADLFFDGVTLSTVCAAEVSTDSSIKTVDGAIIFPGFCDVHVHFREPGFSYKETVATGSRASARGGYTAVCTMPNLNPVPDSVEHLREQLDIIERDSVIAAIPYGAITVGELGERLADLDGMAPYVVGFSDDGKGVQDEGMMESAMRRCAALGKILAAHCEDNSLLHGGYIHDGEYAKEHGHPGISSESEWRPIERDIELVKKTGVSYHVCHVSTKESVELIRRAKRAGVDITAETGPHYLTLDDSSLTEDARFKMNPPLRDRKDREALVLGLLDGTIDMIATDHAPHSDEEKARGLKGSPMGVVGIETAFAVMYTRFVKTGVITLDELVRLMSYAPRERFGITADPGFTVFDVSTEFTVDPSEFLSKGHSTPFKDERLFGKCLLTVYGGKIAYADKSLVKIRQK